MRVEPLWIIDGVQPTAVDVAGVEPRTANQFTAMRSLQTLSLPAAKEPLAVFKFGSSVTGFDLSGDRVQAVALAHQALILDACRRPMAIAEVAVRLSVPIGVARVLVSDLAATRHVEVCATADMGDAALVRRLIAGVRAI